MARYFFHIRDNSGLVMDDEGTEFEDLEAAKNEAADICADWAALAIRECKPLPFCEIEIWNEIGGPVLTFHASEIMLHSLLKSREARRSN